MTFKKLMTVVTLVAFTLPSFSYAAAYSGLAEGLAEGVIQDNRLESYRYDLYQRLESPEVQAELERLGIQQQEVETRLAAMTPAELQQVLDGEHRIAGGDVVVISAGAVALVALVVLLIILLRDRGGDGGVTVVK